MFSLSDIMYNRRSPKKNQLKQKKKSKSKSSSEVISTPVVTESVPIKKKSSKIKLLDSHNKEIKQEKYKGFMLSLKLRIFKTKIINK